MKTRPLRLSAVATTLGLTLLLAGVLSADNGPLHQVFQARPISLGTSGGNINDRSKAFCCSGTLGALVAVGTTQHVLSNNHVLARSNKGTLGDDIIQPGLIDANCFQDTSRAVADLSDFEPILFTRGTTNVVDAAIAQVRPNMVRSDGAILDIGVISSAPTEAAIGMAVMKSGRTTGLTTGAVTAVNVTVSVKYGSPCGGGRGTATFTNQIFISPGDFSAGGDSGSLIVTQDPGRQPVGLLFAGSSSVTIANRIQDVLAAFPGATMVGSSQSGRATFWKWLGRLLPGPRSAHAAGPGQHPVDPASQAAASQAKERHAPAIMRINGVVGVGVGASDVVPGEAVVEVYVERDTPAVRAAIPAQLDNVPVKIVETGEITARTDSCPLDR